MRACAAAPLLVCGFLISALAVSSGSAAAAPVSTAFTYQGRLTDGGSPPTGTYDLQFRLFDALTGGTQIGSTIQLDNVSVTNGLFTVSLDFGGQFSGDARWVELGVHPGSQPVGNPYTILSPRQPLTAAPYALGLRLPLSETVTTSSDAINVTNAGTGDCAQFNITDPANVGEAVEGRTAGGGDAIQGINTGTGHAGYFQISNSANSAPAIYAITDGTGRAGFFESTNPSTNQTALRVATNSTNANAGAIAGINNGNGPAAIFQTGSSSLNIKGDSINSDVGGFLNLLKINDTSTNATWLGGGGGNVGIGGGTAGLPLTRLHIDGGTDANPTSITSGYLLIGASNGPNIVMDNNEIMARNDSAVATLFLNHGGGEVHIGQGSAGTGKLLTPVLQITGGSDLSENFDVTTLGEATAEPGMVVCIDAQNPGKLTLCKEAYDRTVAGIISGAGDVKPGMLMGQSGTLADGAHPVALTGRVYVRCDASQHAIQPGDLLTTSDIAGHAMKVTDHARAHGAIIGKAMTALSEGQGLVLVLVSLQ
jgi:hypothetical protein